MGRKILCTTGTSIAGGGKSFQEADQKEEYRSHIRQRREDLRQKTGSPEEFFRKLSAETHSLAKLKVSESDEVVLLHSETLDGQLCAEAVKEVLENELGLHPRLVKIEGLQVNNGKRFRRVGIQKLFEVLTEETKGWVENPEQRVILNATGGFKSVVPYVTLFGLLHRLEVVYIFEWSSELLRLPPVPVNFDYERLAQAENALRGLQQEGAMPKERFFELIPGLPYTDRSWYESLLEEDEQGYVTLSAFGSLLASSLEREQSQVYLSPDAHKTYSKSDWTERQVWDMVLSKLADPLWRMGHRHTFHGTDLEVYKPDRMPHRVAGFLRGDRIYVCLFYASHQEYERDLPNRRRAEWINRLAEFTPWYPSSKEKPPSTEQEVFDRCKNQLEQAEQNCQQMEIALRQAEQDRQQMEAACQQAKDEVARLTEENRLLKEGIQTFEENLASAKARANQLQTQIEDLAAELQSKEEEMKKLSQLLTEMKEALAWANRPWWRKLLGLPPVTTRDPST